MKKIMEQLMYTYHLIKVSRGRYWRANMVHAPFEIRTGARPRLLMAPTDDPSAAGCFFDVYVEDSYDLRTLAKSSTPKVIVDIGANIGVFSVYSQMMFPDAKIYAYEPNPVPFAWLEKNREQFGFTTNRCAVSNSGGVMRFDPGSSSTNGVLSQAGEIEVSVMAATEVAEGKSIDLLKLDCEGGEWKIFEDPALLRRSQHLTMEFHIIDQRGISDLCKLIVAGGHEVKYILERSGTPWGMLRSVLKQK